MGTKIDNKGFTLVELIAVMVILVSIALVAVGGITSSLEKREIKECKEQKELAISAAKIYFSLNDATSVSIGELNSSDSSKVDYFKNDNKIDRLSRNDKIYFIKGKYAYASSDDSCVDGDEVEFMVTFDPSGGEVTNTSKNVTNGSTYGLLPTATKSGYVFGGWNTKNDGSGTTITSDSIVSLNDNQTLYALWIKSKVTIKYNVAGGTITTSTTSDDGTVYNWSTDTEGNILRNNKILTTSIAYGGQTVSSGLPNYNNSEYLNVTKSGYFAASGAEWICMSGCTIANKTYNHNTVYSANDFCDATYGDCTVVVKVNWKNTYTVSYNANGGSGAPSSQTKYHDITLTLSSTIPTRSGYVFLGWSTSSSATSPIYKASGNYTANSSTTLYAVWGTTTTTSGYVQYELINDYDNNTGTVTVYYNTSYNPVTNQTTVSFTQDAVHRLGAGEYISFDCTTSITVKATDSGKTASSSIYLSGNKGSGYSLYYNIPSPSSIVVQHSNTTGSKSVTITSWTDYNPSDWGCPAYSNSKTITVGTYKG